MLFEIYTYWLIRHLVVELILTLLEGREDHATGICITLPGN